MSEAKFRDLAQAISDQSHLHPELVEVALEVAQALLEAGVVRGTTGWLVNHRPNGAVQFTPGRDYSPSAVRRNGEGYKLGHVTRYGDLRSRVLRTLDALSEELLLDQDSASDSDSDAR